MKRYIGNAFSLNMIDAGHSVFTRPIGVDTVRNILNRTTTESIVGHQDMANIVSNMLGIYVAYNRASVKLNPGDQLIVAQYTGPRLPEGTTELPKDSSINFMMVTVDCPLRPYSREFDEGSLYGALLNRGREIAAMVEGQAVAMEDSHGNFTVEIMGRGFHGTIWDD